MRAIILYHPRSDHSREVEDYVRTFERVHGKKIELLSLETQAGAHMARLYDIVRYPALLALRQDGQVLKDWQDEHLPLMDEVAGYIEK